MKVKKVFALLLAATMVLGMTACGDSDKESSSNSGADSSAVSESEGSQGEA